MVQPIGHGGGKGAVRRVLQHLPQHRFVLKTDVRSYYASIDHHLLLDRLAEHVTDRRVLNLIGQYLQRCAERGGLYWEYRRGIALGCPLSPIMGAFFLRGLDERLEKSGLFFARFMDYVLVLAPTRWKLRRAVRVVNEVLGGLRLEKHPEKTLIGSIEKGFDFLGYHSRPGSLALAEKTVEHFVARAIRLYEQGPGEVLASARLGEYVRRWVRWARAGLHGRHSRYGGREVRDFALLLSCANLPAPPASAPVGHHPADPHQACTCGSGRRYARSATRTGRDRKSPYTSAGVQPGKGTSLLRRPKGAS